MKVSNLNNYKNNLYSSLSRDLSEFEKNFLLISGGILAFSITFIKEIVKIENACAIYLLYISWLLIIISIGLMMYTFLKSAKASDELWKLVDQFIIDNQLYNEDDDLSCTNVDKIKNDINTIFYQRKKQLKNLRFSAVYTFIAGIFFLAIYVSINLYIESNIKDNNNYNYIKVDGLEIKETTIGQKNQTKKIILHYGKDSVFLDFKTSTNTNTETNTTNKASTSDTTKTSATIKKR